MKNFAFHRPQSVADALTLLRADDAAKLLSGGQSLLPVMKLDCFGEVLGDRSQRLAEPAGLQARQQFVEGRGGIAGHDLLVCRFQLGDEDQLLPACAGPAPLVGHRAQDLAKPGKGCADITELGRPTRAELHFLDPDGNQLELVAWDYPMNDRAWRGRYDPWPLAYSYASWPPNE